MTIGYLQSTDSTPSLTECKYPITFSNYFLQKIPVKKKVTLYIDIKSFRYCSLISLATMQHKILNY